MINNFSKLRFGIFMSIFKANKLPSYVMSKQFSSGGHDAHAHGEQAEADYHPRKYDRVSYNRKLSDTEREKIPFMDYMNEKEVDYLKPKIFTYKPERRYEVLVPFESAREDREDLLLDRTEVQARIYNILRQFDFKPLEEIDFDGDYEKDLGLDSLEWTALITSVEHEFHTVFEDSLYEHFRTINDFVSIMEKDFACF